MVYKNCWDEVSATNCVYSGHSLIGDELHVFVERGLDTWSERLSKHVGIGGSFGVQKCVLIFHGVARYKWQETPFAEHADGTVTWGPAEYEDVQLSLDSTENYFLDGTAVGAAKSVWAEIWANGFSLDAE